MRYVVALLVACLLIGAGTLYVRLAHRSIEFKLREALRRQKEAGTLPPELQDVDPDAAALADMQVKLSRGDETRLQAAMWLSDLWYVLAPLTVAICLGAAWLIGRWRRGPD
jgi:hypothetical protein